MRPAAVTGRRRTPPTSARRSLTFPRSRGTKALRVWGSALSYTPELAWNESAPGLGLGASGGGVSLLVSKPDWQAGPGVPNDGARDVPDVAMAAAIHDAYF